jgi:hypothetical protein
MSNHHPWLSANLPGEQQTSTWPLTKENHLIGREEPADIILPFVTISRQHARLTLVENRLVIADLGSRNGTFLNGEVVESTPQLLQDGDLLVLGGAVTLQFHDPKATVEGPQIGLLEGIWIDSITRDVWVDARRVEPPLSPTQFTLLELLYRSPGQVISHPELTAAVWPEADPQGVSKDAINSLIKRLRARLRQAQPDCEYIEVMRGHGLRLIHPKNEPTP